MAIDTVETLNGALIHHGPHSDRIYVMRLNTANVPDLLVSLENLACDRGYGKIFAKIPAEAWPAFKSAGYIEEAVVPGFFNGQADGHFGAKYLVTERQRIPSTVKRLKNEYTDEKYPVDLSDRASPANGDVVACQPSDAEEMSAFYREVFQSYPFPIHNSAYLKAIMNDGGRYFCIRKPGGIAAMAAAEIDAAAENVEMTDFATRPDWRGRGLAGTLLRRMEGQMRGEGILTAYTIARATSPGINAVFKLGGYCYAGFLKNNTQIGGKIESMIVWYKPLKNPTHHKNRAPRSENWHETISVR